MFENDTLSKMIENGTFTDMFLFIKKPKKLLDVEIQNAIPMAVYTKGISTQEDFQTAQTNGLLFDVWTSKVQRSELQR